MLKDKERIMHLHQANLMSFFINTTLCFQEKTTISPQTQQKKGTTYKNNPLIFNSRIQVDFWVPKS